MEILFGNYCYWLAQSAVKTTTRWFIPRSQVRSLMPHKRSQWLEIAYRHAEYRSVVFPFVPFKKDPHRAAGRHAWQPDEMAPKPALGAT